MVDEDVFEFLSVIRAVAVELCCVVEFGWVLLSGKLLTFSLHSPFESDPQN